LALRLTSVCRFAVCSVKHKPDGSKKNPDGSQKLLTCAQEGTSEIGDFLKLETDKGQGQKVYWTYDVLFEVCCPQFLQLVGNTL
jgi:hypothetical protein